MFRVNTLNGSIIDAVLALRGSKPIDDEYYKEVASNNDQGSYRLQNQKLGNILKFDLSNVVFTKDAYDLGSAINIEKSLGEFEVIWNAINGILQMHDVRRIGFSVEHRIDLSGVNPNSQAMATLCKLSTPSHPAKFLLHFEDRRPTKEGHFPDIEKSHFVNVIYDYYDSDQDVDHPEPGFLNANIDYQQYYSPLISRNIWDEVKIHSRRFNDELKSFRTSLKDKKLVS